MKSIAKGPNKFGELLARLHRDDRGADMVEYILIIAIVSLPLLGVLIYYWHDIVMWVNQKWGEAKSGQETDPTTITH